MRGASSSLGVFWRPGGSNPLGSSRYSAALLALVSVFAGVLVLVLVLVLGLVLGLEDEDESLELELEDDDELLLLLLLPYPSEYQPPPFKMKFPLTI